MGAAFRLLLLISALAYRVARSSSSRPFILRIRRPDGLVQRIGFESESEALSLTLKQVLERAQDILQGQEQFTIRYGMSSNDQRVANNEEPQTLKQLGIRHGTMLTVLPPSARETSDIGPKMDGAQPKRKSLSSLATQDRWDPFPDLAKDYEGTIRQIQRRKVTSAKLSFSDLSAMHRALHVVEPQSQGPIHRLYLCQTAAERFCQSCIVIGEKQSQQSRVGLLLGTIHRERKDPKRLRHKTSLSSTTEAEEFCEVAKVQAVWEPPQPQASKDLYDATDLLRFVENEKILNVAEWLGLVPVGWIYSYPEPRSGKVGDNDDSLPVFGCDLETGARLQIAAMKARGREEGSRFVTVAMHVPTGATEAFQLSDVAVQMVAENMLVLGKEDGAAKKPQRHVSTKHCILVDGRETTSLDSVLCLVNTALLSHQGTFTGDIQPKVKKNNPYQLTKKMRKALAEALKSNEPGKILELVCNFSVLVALYDDLPRQEMEVLVQTVRKFSRGQKKGVALDPKVVKALEYVVA